MQQRTVRDFKKLVEKTLGPQQPNMLRSDEVTLFSKKLDRLGGEKRTKEYEDCEDVDATAPLSDKEWAELEQELEQLKELEQMA